MSLLLRPKSFRDYVQIVKNMHTTHMSITELLNMGREEKELSFTDDDESSNTENEDRFPVNKKGGKKAGTWNYTQGDVRALLDLVEEHEPIGANGWARVAHNYNSYARENDRPRRKQESLKKKYDKMLYVKKQTGDPTCPPNVRRAKNIQKEILSKMVSLTYNDDATGENEQPVEGSPIDNHAEPCNNQRVTRNSPRLNTPQKRPLMNPSAPFSKRLEIDLMESIKQMSHSMTDLAAAQLNREQQERGTRDDMEKMIAMAIDKSHAELERKMASCIKDTLRSVLAEEREDDPLQAHVHGAFRTGFIRSGVHSETPHD